MCALSSNNLYKTIQLINIIGQTFIKNVTFWIDFWVKSINWSNLFAVIIRTPRYLNTDQRFRPGAVKSQTSTEAEMFLSFPVRNGFGCSGFVLVVTRCSIRVKSDASAHIFTQISSPISNMGHFFRTKPWIQALGILITQAVVWICVDLVNFSFSLMFDADFLGHVRWFEYLWWIYLKETPHRASFTSHSSTFWSVWLWHLGCKHLQLHKSYFFQLTCMDELCDPLSVNKKDPKMLFS